MNRNGENVNKYKRGARINIYNHLAKARRHTAVLCNNEWGKNSDNILYTQKMNLESRVQASYQSNGVIVIYIAINKKTHYHSTLFMDNRTIKITEISKEIHSRR